MDIAHNFLSSLNLESGDTIVKHGHIPGPNFPVLANGLHCFKAGGSEVANVGKLVRRGDGSDTMA